MAAHPRNELPTAAAVVTPSAAKAANADDPAAIRNGDHVIDTITGARGTVIALRQGMVVIEHPNGARLRAFAADIRALPEAAGRQPTTAS
ncbi:hypothetical protein CTZ27_07045 [Streptomyces griseocarneus]|nr:hypothetical protein CTZ27_07045 [Streptomyces griseocarneus]